MIDEKKIEEASKEYSIHYVQGHRAAYKAFKAGISWLLDNLWHDASEEPKEDVSILVDTNNGIHSASYIESIYYVENADGVRDSEYTKNAITRWLYIDDLLKGGK